MNEFVWAPITVFIPLVVILERGQSARLLQLGETLSRMRGRLKMKVTVFCFPFDTCFNYIVGRCELNGNVVPGI